MRTVAVLGLLGLVSVCQSEDPPTSQPEELSPKVRITKDEVDALPRFGSGNITDKVKLNLGKVFVGETKSGVVALRNPTKSSIRIEDVKSSCGCTAIYPVSKMIPADGNLDMVVKFRGSKPGPIQSSITIETDAQTYLVRISAHGRMPLELTQPTTQAVDGVCRFALKINDERLEPSLLSALVDGTPCKKLKCKGQMAEFEFACKSREYAVVIPRYDNKADFAPQRLEISHPGQYRLATTVIYPTKDDSNIRFRLLLMGDHGIDEGEKQCRIQVGKATVDARLSCKQLGKILHMEVTLPKSIEGSAKMNIDGKDVTFSLRGIQ